MARSLVMAPLRIVAMAAAVFGALGCATTQGSAWVSEPEPGPFAHDDVSLTAEHPIEALDEPRTSLLVSELDSDSAPRARPRLDRTVTLGEVISAPPAERAAPAPASGAPVNVTINNYVTPAPNTDGGYYGGYVGGYRPIHDGGRPTHPVAPAKPNAAPTQPGQSWPAIPSYGPSFPFKTAPASPWR